MKNIAKMYKDLEEIKKYIHLSFLGMNISDKKESEILNVFEAIYTVRKLKIK